MPICEADPWRLQYFEHAPCPPDVRIPTEDADAWAWNPEHRWIYDKLRVAESQGLACAPHGVAPPAFPVFSKPIFNLKGMGTGSRALRTLAEYDRRCTPGHFWMTLLAGEHVSSDCAVAKGEARWWRHATGKPFGRGMFDFWTIHAASYPELEDYLGRWLAAHMPGYTGMLNFETIGGRIIEIHMRFADQWCDLYGKGWVEALVRLYAEGRWDFPDHDRRDGYSIALFGRHGHAFRHPRPHAQSAVRVMPQVSSLQITFYEDKPPEAHPMPPGGFRLGIVNATDLEAGQQARRALAASFPDELILWPQSAAPLSSPLQGRGRSPLRLSAMGK